MNGRLRKAFQSLGKMEIPLSFPVLPKHFTVSQFLKILAVAVNTGIVYIHGCDIRNGRKVV